MINLTKSKAMVVLLSALNVSQNDYKIYDNYIELNLNSQQLFYRIASTSDAVQHVYGNTDEWKELISKYSLPL